MKKTIGFLGIAVLCVLSLGFLLACSSDDDGGGGVPSELQGKWTDAYGINGFEITGSQIIQIVNESPLDDTACDINVTGDGKSGTIEVTSSPGGVYNDSTVDYKISGGDILTLSNGTGALFSSLTYTSLIKQED
jgi:hypothetical protein